MGGVIGEGQGLIETARGDVVYGRVGGAIGPEGAMMSDVERRRDIGQGGGGVLGLGARAWSVTRAKQQHLKRQQEKQ